MTEEMTFSIREIPIDAGNAALSPANPVLAEGLTAGVGVRFVGGAEPED